MFPIKFLFTLIKKTPNDLIILQLFAKGKMKVKGNVMLAQKLSTLFKDQAKL